MDDVTHETFLNHGWTVDKKLPIWNVITFAIGLISAVAGGIVLLNQLRVNVENMAERQALFQRELEFQKEITKTLPERLKAVEVKLEETSAKQSEAFGELKTLIVQTRPRNSAPSLRRQ